MGALSKCRDDAVRMGVGHVSDGAAGSPSLVGNAAAGGFAATHKRLVRLRFALGIHPDDQSVAGPAAALPAGMGGVPRQARGKALCLETGPGRGNSISLLRAVDGEKLRCISQAGSTALEFSLGTLYRKQQQLCDASVRLAAQDHQERELLLYFRLGEVAFMEEEQRKAMEFIRAHTGIAIELMAEKFVSFWTGVAEPVQVFKTTDSLLIRALIVCNTLAAAGALLGIVVLFVKHNPYAVPAAIYPLVFPWLYYVTHPNLRYRHPIDPVILLLAAVAAASAWRSVAHALVNDAPVTKETA